MRHDNATDRAGYDPTAAGGGRDERRRLVIAWALTAPALAWMLARSLLGAAWPSEPAYDLGLAALALTVLLGPGRPLLRRAVGTARSGVPDAEVLVATAGAAAALTGVGAVLRDLGLGPGIENLAGASAAIVTLHLTARHVEGEARSRATLERRTSGSTRGRRLRSGRPHRPPVAVFDDERRPGFVPVVLAIAAAALAGWLLLPGLFGSVASRAASSLPWMVLSEEPLSLAVGAAVAVLAVSCPHVVEAATETALSVEAALGSGRGIRVGTTGALRTLADADVLVIDKTGTLTEGRPELMDVRTTESVPPRELLALAAAVERESDHPMGRAVVRGARQIGLRLPDARGFEADPGRGVRALVDGRVALVGSERMMKEAGIDVSPIQPVARQLVELGRTVMFVALAGRVRGVVAVADRLTPSSAAAVSELRDLGVEPVLLSGDDGGATARVAERTGIERFRGGLVPDEKADVVAELRERGRTVAVVASGTGATPMREASDVALGLGGGPGDEDERFDVSLAGDDLRAVVDALRLCRAIRSRLRGGRVGAWAYHAATVPAAILGVLPPVLAAGAAFTFRVWAVRRVNRLEAAELAAGTAERAA